MNLQLGPDSEFQSNDCLYCYLYIFVCNILKLRPSLKNCQLGVTSVEKRQQQGREFLFFLRNPFKYCADAVILSTDIKPIFVFFTEIKPKIKQFLSLLESIIPFFTHKMLHTLGLLFNEYKN